MRVNELKRLLASYGCYELSPGKEHDVWCSPISGARIRIPRHQSREVPANQIVLIMKVLAIVEKGSDGLFSVYSDAHIGKSYFGGFGNSVSEAKDDFVVSVKEAISEERREGHKVPVFEDIIITYKYDLPSFFNCFDFINVSRFAEFAGINESKMRAYKSGVAFPGEKTTAKILKAIQHIGVVFTSVSL